MITLGQKVRCVVTGFEGVATSRVEYLNGCVQYYVRPPVDKDGKLQDGEYIDSQQLKVVGDGTDVTPIVTGGVMPNTPPSRYQ